MKKRVKRIALGPGKRAARARKLYSEIGSGARKQQSIRRLFERRFFDKGFDSRQLVEQAARFKGSKKQRIELREYAKRLARKRNWTLKRFRKWGIEKKHMGKPMERTPSGTSAKKIAYGLTGWHDLGEKVEMVPTFDLIAFSIGMKPFREIVRKDMPMSKKAEAYFYLPETIPANVLLSPNLERIEKYMVHERQHARTINLPIMQELYESRKNTFSPRTLTRGFAPTNLKIGAKSIGRELLDELIGNMVENGLGFFEKRYQSYYISDIAADSLGPKTAKALMHNKGKHKERMLEATAQSIKEVRKALTATVTDSKGRKRKVVSREELAGLLANIRDIEKVPKRLPVLVEMRKERLRKRPAGKGG